MHMKAGTTVLATIAVCSAAIVTGCGPAVVNKTPDYGTTSAPTHEATADDFATVRASSPAQQDRSTYKELTPREFALLARDPDSHVNEKVVIYGKVIQFDSATGQHEFRANTGALAPGVGESYSQNTYLLVPVASVAANVVEKDHLRMFAQVMGSYTYETTSNGHITVPKFAVYLIDNLTSAGAR